MPAAKQQTAQRTGTKASAAAKRRRNQRTSIGNAKARSQRSVKSAERRSTGPTSMEGVWTKPRSQRVHPGKARKNQGLPKSKTSRTR